MLGASSIQGHSSQAACAGEVATRKLISLGGGDRTFIILSFPTPNTCAAHCHTSVLRKEENLIPKFISKCCSSIVVRPGYADLKELTCVLKKLRRGQEKSVRK